MCIINRSVSNPWQLPSKNRRRLAMIAIDSKLREQSPAAIDIPIPSPISSTSMSFLKIPSNTTSWVLPHLAREWDRASFFLKSNRFRKPQALDALTLAMLVKFEYGVSPTVPDLIHRAPSRKSIC